MCRLQYIFIDFVGEIVRTETIFACESVLRRKGLLSRCAHLKMILNWNICIWPLSKKVHEWISQIKERNGHKNFGWEFAFVISRSVRLATNFYLGQHFNLEIYQTIFPVSYDWRQCIAAWSWCHLSLELLLPWMVGCRVSHFCTIFVISIPCIYWSA